MIVIMTRPCLRENPFIRGLARCPPTAFICIEVSLISQELQKPFPRGPSAL
jgi:hypothetical protein